MTGIPTLKKLKGAYFSLQISHLLSLRGSSRSVMANIDLRRENTVTTKSKNVSLLIRVRLKIMNLMVRVN